MARSLAERFRANREALELSLELGCTPAEAALEIEKRAVRARWEEGRRRLEALRNRPLTAPILAEPDRERGEPWMMRD